MANILDVARLAGVSKTTVSRVINNYPHISADKRELVLKAMEELEYTPNLSARRLRGQVTTTIAVVVPRIVNPFFSYLVDSIEKVGYKNGYQTLICQTNEDKERELTYLNLLKTKQADGIIMASIENDWKVIEPYTEFGPIVLCNEYVSNAKIPMIRLDQFKGTYLGIKHLIERGHRKIAYCTGGLFTEAGKDKDRNLGYQKALEEAGIQVNPNWILVNQHTIEDGKKVMKLLLEMKDRPTAVFTGSDEIAGGLMMAAKKEGLSIPRDLAIIGFDDQPLAEMLDPALTTIRQPIEQMGRKAGEVLMEMLDDFNVEPVTYELPVELVVREST
ncbi:LacI family DNA-binding transcriptional regulator [Paenibacillus sp. NPDC058367]|uniref:LacI family DNA-binding transcriptional regulator n=1 Tax=unclassified Paenibacillus TaxID=185978 RepID=UPI0004F59253|nr:LacI family DNA-binding transcriptional regulator [Paenibacillus sp. FSL H7-0737]AIQ22084.1 LacI family transcriptional regulator [Paenibacillus sp. FSL H7-0737]